MMLISVLPVSAMAAELTPSDPETGLTATDVTNELTDSDRLAIFEENMDSSKVSRSEIPADDEMVKVIVQLDADSLLDVRNRTNASMSMLDFQQTDAAKAQLKDIANLQLSVMNAMESKGIPSSFTFSYTSVVSGFAAQVPYGKIHEIKSIDGVVDVVLCQTYYTDSMGSATLGQALTAAEVAAYSNNTQYQGEGMLIGILDTGLDVNHEAFANAPAVQKLQKSSLSKLLYQISQGEDGKTNVTAYSYAALWYAQKHSSSSLVLLTEDDLYKSGKVPFAFDYADADADVIPSADAVEKYGNDHGTHVAGITAGKTVDADGSVTFAGQSPEAQLAIFKVFSDSTNGASTDPILAALNDALLLDVDVINMSLGSNGGFGREAEGDLTTKYYDLVKSAGILLNCSAGNSYSSSQGGAKGDFTSVSDPDTGIISSSSSYDAALSVASVNANETAAFVTAQGRVPYQDVSGHDFTALLLGNDSSRTYEYVMVPNTGDTADYQGLDVTGKIAVVMRGGLSFEQKQLNAASAGAAGCIIYNNRDGYLLNMAVDNYKIPTVCISLANGQMMEAAQEKTLTVSKTEKGSVAMSDFSSWGPLPSLSLKPEITAPGGSIYSSLPFAQYGYMSGTSMASPYLAGVAAAALQYVNTLMPGASDTDKQLLVNRLLMSTADILYDENGVAYSPRKQGSGMVNLAMGDAAENATASNVTVSADEKTVTVNVLAKDAATNGLFTVDYDAANLTLTNVAFNTQYSSYKDASGKVTLGYVDLNGVAAGSTVATLTFTVKDPTALDKINVTVTETERNDQTVNNAETLTADLHTETETVNAKAATCTEDGYTGDVVCKACGKVITKGEVIPALGHKIELVGAKAATCTEDGYTGDEVCTVCGEIVKKGEVIPALGHKIKLVGAKEPTCTEDGYTGDEVCTICGEIVKKGEVIKATGHQYKDGKCTVCGAADPNYKPAVKTGDESNTALWVLVMASAALLAAAVVVLPRKKHSR